MRYRPLVFVQSDFDRSDPLWDKTPSMGEEGFIATVHDRDSLIRILSTVLARQRKSMSS